MLEPEYFQDKCDRMIEIYRELENYILNDIAQRLLKAGEMSGTADHMVWKLTQMGEHRSTILAKLSKITKMSRSELKSLLQGAVLTSWDDDVSTLNKLGIVPPEPLKNKDVMRLMDAEYIKSNGELENLTRTTLDKSQKDLINMLDTAEIRVAAGVQSYSSAICEILDDYAEDGIRVGYPTGAERTLESAVRMIVVTSMNQTSAQVTNYYIAEGNVEYVLVSAHLGARPQAKGQPYLAGHENWQGKAYKIRGSEEGFPNLLESTGYDITEDGEGRVADPRGLHGYNCRHSHRPWDKDLRNPYLDENGKLKIDTEENRRIYELQQRQRAMERGIRKTKRELLVKKQELSGIAETDVKDILQEQYDKLALKLREQNKAYGEYCEQNGFDRQEDRLKAAGFNRKQAAEANGRATAESNRANAESREALKNPLTGDTIRLGVGSSRTEDATKRTELGSIDTKKTESAMEYFTDEIRDCATENAVVIEKSGKVVQFASTSSESVYIFDVDYDSAYITHNHPASNGLVSFGKDDFNFLQEYPNIASLRCCNAEYDYAVSVKEDISQLAYSELYREALGRSTEDDDVQHIVFEVLKERGYVDYDRSARKKD